ncbi:TetR/AcrR family transcriptional regulator [Streptomyces sp. NBC_00400]|uniref:TetR/AcrR family transcriptional regulator n=1 Tax=Streptomyces sp. NBC_00400 TaxID=2975737 RepID=UPI002E1C0820
MPAEHADVTRQTLYHHWPNRAALLFGLILETPSTPCSTGRCSPGSSSTAARQPPSSSTSSSPSGSAVPAVPQSP